jgi:hypothetical protein
MWRLTEDGSEAANEVRRGYVGHSRHSAHVKRLRVGAIHRVSGSEQAPVEILDFPAHPANPTAYVGSQSKLPVNRPWTMPIW